MLTAIKLEETHCLNMGDDMKQQQQQKIPMLMRKYNANIVVILLASYPSYLHITFHYQTMRSPHHVIIKQNNELSTWGNTGI